MLLLFIFVRVCAIVCVFVCVRCRSVLLALGISVRFSAPISMAFLSGESFTPGSRTEEVRE